jgi:hypothetical protein
MYARNFDLASRQWSEKTSRWRRHQLRAAVEQATLQIAFCAEDAKLGEVHGPGDKQRYVDHHGHFGSQSRRGNLKSKGGWDHGIVCCGRRRQV